MINWRHYLKRKKQKKSSDIAATNEDAGAFVHRGDVVWPDNVENDGQRETAVGNWRQLTEARKGKNRVTTRRQTRTLVRFFLRSDVAWFENVEDDGQRETAAGYWRQPHNAGKAKKIERRRGDRQGLWCFRSSRLCGLARPRKKYKQRKPAAG